jgi:hypothetical protein
MFKHILFPTDGSAAALQAVPAVIALAGLSQQVSATIAVVVSPLTPEQSDCQSDYLERHNAWLRKEAQRVIRSESDNSTRRTSVATRS